jgi:hypothetical protein
LKFVAKTFAQAVAAAAAVAVNNHHKHFSDTRFEGLKRVL